MFTSPEQFAAATKTLFELQMTTFNTLASKAVQGVEQVVALNMSTAKENLPPPQDPQAAMQAVAAYSGNLKQLIDDIQQEFDEAADAHMKEAKNTLSALIYDVTQNVKPGSTNAVAIVKSAIDNAFRGYEEVTNATRNAKKQVDDQIARAVEQVTKPGRR